MKLTPCKLKEIVREEVQRLSEDEIGWDNLPDGWDEDSLESFAQNLTGQEGEEGFFSACMDEVEDEFDDPEAFCASLKDEYLGTTDWREGPNGDDDETNESVKLTESKLRRIIQEEARDLREQGPDRLPPRDQFDRFFRNNGGMQVEPELYYYDDHYFHFDRMGGMALFVNVFRGRNDSESVANAKIEGDKVRLKTPSNMPGGKPRIAKVRFRSAEQVVEALLERARGDMGVYR